MTATITSRVFGALALALLGLAASALLAPHANLPGADIALAGAGIGALVGLAFAHIPLRLAAELSIAQALAALLGGLLGAGLGLLLAYPLSLLGAPGLPALVSLVMAALGVQVFLARADDIAELLPASAKRTRNLPAQASRQLLLDTSVLIDGRIVDIAETGFIGGSLLIPRFVLGELHRVADSADSLRRNRGRRGLAKLNDLQRAQMQVEIIDDDPNDSPDVDGKLVSLALERGAALVTNDYNLGQVADAQGVAALNINALANAVRSVYIPGEAFNIRIIQTGKDANQGVGYLDDGTMVVVESGQQYLNRSIDVEVTKLINRPTGRMIFAAPRARMGR